MDSTHRPSATAPVAMASPERTGSMPVTYVDSSNVEAFGNDLDFRVTHAVFVEAPTRIGRVLHLLTELPVSDPSAGDDAAAPPSSSKRSSWGGSEPVVFALDEASSEEASVAGSPPEPIATADGNNSDSGESSTGSVTADHARLTLAARTIDEALVNEVMSVWDDERSAERSAVLVRGRRAAVAAAKEDPSLAAVRGDIYQELCTLRTNLQMFSMYWNSRFPYDAHYTAVQDLGMRLKPLACDALEQASAYIDAHDRYSGLWTTAAEEIYDALALDPTPVLDRLHSAEINMAHRLTVHIHFICGTYAQLHRLVTEGLGDFVPKHDLLGATADAVVRAQADAAAAAAAAAETGCSKGRKRRSVSPGRRATEGKAMQAARSAPTSSSFSSTMNYFTQP